MTVQQQPEAHQPEADCSPHEGIRDYLSQWTVDQRQVRPVFTRLINTLSGIGAGLEFVVRPGVSASLRAASPEGNFGRPLFCLVDVVQDPEGPWLSVCFYADTVTDPDDLGNLVPKGLLGEDGYCFDVEQPDQTLEGYVHERIREALACSGPDSSAARAG